MGPERGIVVQDIGRRPAAVETVGPGQGRIEDGERDVDGVEGTPGVETGDGQTEVMLEGAVDCLL